MSEVDEDTEKAMKYIEHGLELIEIGLQLWKYKRDSERETLPAPELPDLVKFRSLL